MTQLTPDPYLSIAVLAIAAAGFAIAPLGLAWLWAKKFSPRKPGPNKNATYECGLEAKDEALIQFRPEYYLYAIIFLDLRCRGDFSAAVRGVVWRADGGRVDCDDDLSAAAGGRAGVGVAEGRVDLGVRLSAAEALQIRRDSESGTGSQWTRS